MSDLLASYWIFSPTERSLGERSFVERSFVWSSVLLSGLWVSDLLSSVLFSWSDLSLGDLLLTVLQWAMLCRLAILYHVQANTWHRVDDIYHVVRVWGEARARLEYSSRLEPEKSEVHWAYQHVYEHGWCENSAGGYKQPSLVRECEQLQFSHSVNEEKNICQVSILDLVVSPWLGHRTSLALLEVSTQTNNLHFYHPIICAINCKHP